MSSKKQKVVSKLPSTSELHLPGGYNWVGPGTEIMDRISLSYKGKVGTVTYWLPKDKLDLAAFKHDIAYYSPSNDERIKADYELLSTVDAPSRSATVDILISTQMAGRGLQELFTARKSFLENMEGLQSLASSINLLASVAPIKGRGSIAGWLFNPRTGIMPQSIKDFARTHLGIRGTRVGRRQKDYIRNTILRLGIVFSGTAYRNIHELVTSVIEKTDILKKSEHEKAVDKVYDKYLEYLDTIGEFREGEFVLTKKGDSSKYEEFFNEFKDYIEDMNKTIKKKNQRYKIPVLNSVNLPLSEQSLSSPPVEQIPEPVTREEATQKPGLDISGGDRSLNVVDFGAAPRKLKPEIVSVLAGREKPLGRIWDNMI